MTQQNNAKSGISGFFNKIYNSVNSERVPESLRSGEFIMEISHNKNHKDGNKPSDSIDNKYQMEITKKYCPEIGVLIITSGIWIGIFCLYIYKTPTVNWFMLIIAALTVVFIQTIYYKSCSHEDIQEQIESEDENLSYEYLQKSLAKWLLIGATIDVALDKAGIPRLDGRRKDVLVERVNLLIKRVQQMEAADKESTKEPI